MSEELDGGTVLFRSVSCTDSVSYVRNRASLYWKTLSFIPRKLQQLHDLGPDEFFARAESDNASPEFYSSRLFRTPKPGVVAKLLGTAVAREVKKQISRRFFYNQWLLLLAQEDKLSTNFRRFKRLQPPPDRFWADPHIVYRDGTHYVFIEEFLNSRNRGHIACLEVDAKGRISSPRVVLERDYHLSYPIVFEYQGKLYMVPETHDRRAVELFECHRFPDQWEFSRTLMDDVRAVDTTLFEYDGE